MALTATQMREQMISFALANAEQRDREIEEFQRQITALQKQIEESKQKQAIS